MMKKKTIIALAAACSLQLVHAQKPVTNDLPDRLFLQGKEMFMNGNYVGSQNYLEEFKRASDDAALLTEADYLLVCSEYFQGNEKAGLMLKDFLDANPETYHRDQLCFYIGSTHYEQKEWAKAAFWFSDVDVDYLPTNEQEDYAFRRAYAELQNRKPDVARQLFGLLSQNSEKYKTPAKFYLAYIDFQRGDYDKVVSVFREYQNNPQYAEEATFYLIQSDFLNDRLEGAISEGNAYLKKYPNSKNAVEVQRILGNGYNRTGRVELSIQHYEKYLSLLGDKKPIREDMFLLGSSYSARNENAKAANVLQNVASTTDQLGQAAYLLLGQNYLALNDNANALMAFDAASREKYDTSVSEAALYNYAVLVHRTSLSVFDQSVTVLERFINEYPQSARKKEINGLLASTFMSTKNYKAALEAIGRIKSPDSQILAAKQSILFQLGNNDFVNSNYSSALNNFSASINMGSHDATARRQAYFWRGETYYRMGNYSAAAGDYNSFLSSAPVSDPNHSLALYNLGYSHFQLKNYNSALANFQKYAAAEKDKTKTTYADGLNRLGDCYLYNRNFSAAEKSYSQAAASGQSVADYADFQKAFVLGLQRNYTGKISALDAMMAKYPASQYKENALYEKARAYVMLNRDNDAINVLEGMLKTNSQTNLAQQAGVLLGQLYYNHNNTSKALAAYKRVVAANANSEEARTSIQSMENIYKETNNVNEYVAYVNSLGGAVVISPSRQDSLSYMAAENVFMKGKADAARSAMQTYLQSYPKGAFVGDAHFVLGSLAYNQKDNETALPEFMEAIKNSNSRYRSQSLEYAAKLQLETGNNQQAYDLYRQLQLSAKNSEEKQTAQAGMLKCASALKKDKEVVSAADALLTDVKLLPEVASEARFLRAKANLNLGQKDKALTDLQILAKDTRSVYGAEAQYLIAESYYEAKSYNKAEKQIQDFMTAGTPHQYWMARALILLSDIYAAKGDKFQARQYLESLQANYKTAEVDITIMINERLAALK
ncbi:TolA-binding protein [Dysgonomonas sp. PH5-45]|uniref:tetratricopeptide repeat protein n=1 Tax=unclassified Dysgonomonas TaxID=2630389 RepID=UPI00247725FE|nr:MULTISPECIES: tetratricopeptide repeat protein [unclassified Dysgonomonas]MDH6355505.1 TolA-binding protein [Dysgonomonas sp. PH5-45]MDH6388434.1 TolA-binding protein [Dysgonomonas sp. PH5-37]